MKYYVVTFLILVCVNHAISKELVESSLPDKFFCLMGESKVTKNDYPLKNLKKDSTFFSNVAVSAINKIIKNKPYDQKGIEFSVDLLGRNLFLTGNIVIKESYQQIKLENAKCEKPTGNYEGFNLNCTVKNPGDNQLLYLKYLYKYKSKLGVFTLKVSRSKLGLLTKNIFTCE